MDNPAERCLIVNADDFGISESISKGIIFGHVHGAITSTTAITNGVFFEQAAILAKEHPNFGVGVHLNLDEETPLLPPVQITSIVNSEGRFYNRWEIIRRILLGKADLNDIRAEWSAQIERCLDMGIQPSHLDSHGHLHHLPRLQHLIGDLAQSYDISNIRRTTVRWSSLARNPTAVTKAALLWGCGWLFDRRKSLSGMRRVTSVGLEESGHASHHDLIRHVRSLPAGLTEIMLHPGFSGEDNHQYHGWNYCWEKELQAIVNENVMQEIKNCNIRLINHRQIPGS